MYAVLHIPCFALQSVLRLEEGLADKAVVLVTESESRPVVMEMTPLAELAGVVRGLTVPQAMGRCPETLVRYRSKPAESLAWEALFCSAYSLAPRLEEMAAGTCLVDLRGLSLEKAKLRCLEILEELSAGGLTASVGIAASSSLALLAAKQADGVLVLRQDGQGEEAAAEGTLHHVCHRSFLDALPIEAAEPGEALWNVLQKWGVRTVGAFAKLQRSAVGARLGMEGLALWDRVNGLEQRVVPVAEIAPSFEKSWDFEYDVDSLDPILFLARRFLDQLCLRLRATRKVATRLELELGLAYGSPICLSQKAPEPSNDPDVLFRLLAGRLEVLQAESSVARFALGMEVVDFKERQYGLFESSLKNPQRFAQTLARVAGVVGADRVGSPRVMPDGRPDGFVMQEMPESGTMPVATLPARHHGMALRRYRPAVKAAVEMQGRQPIWLKSAEVSGFVSACRGPWLSSGHWWEAEGSWNRVEWDVELRKGGVYRLVKDAEGWTLEGMYD